MNWMIYPAARAFIKVCSVLFGAGAAAAVLIHLFMPFSSALPEQPRPSCFWEQGRNCSPSFPVLPHVLGRQSSAGLPRKQNNKKSEHAGLPARPVRPPHSVCGHARPIAIYGNGQGLGGRPPSGGRHFFLFLPLYGGIRCRRQEIIPGLGHRGGRLRFAERPVFLAVLLRQFLSTAVPSLAAPVAWLAVLLSCGLEIMLATLSAILAQRLFKEVMSIASMPEPIDPSMPGNRP